MKAIGYFIRGLWRELVCLVVKTRDWYNKLSHKEQFAVWWTVFGIALGIAFSVVIFVHDHAYRIRYNIVYGNMDDYWSLVFLATLSCAAMGAIIVWVVPVFIYAIYASVKHTVKVGS